MGVQDPEAHRAKILIEFMKSKPQMFQGLEKPKVARRWLKEIKKKFDAFKVPKEYRVGFTTYLFEGLAEDWWDSVVDAYDVSDLSWGQFSRLFRKNYRRQGSSSRRSKRDQSRVCSNCGLTGHRKRNCPRRQQRSWGAHTSQTQPASYLNGSTSFASASQPPGLLPKYYPNPGSSFPSASQPHGLLRQYYHQK